MGILFLCKTSQGCDIPIPQCVANDVFFILNTILFFCLSYQLYIRVFILKTPFKMQTIVYYIMIIQSIIYELYNGFESWVWAYLAEIYIRHLCFIYMMYFFALKAWKPHIHRHKNMAIFIIAILITLYFTGVLIYTFARSTTLIICKDIFWLYLSVAGIILSFLFALIIWKLSKGMNRKMKNLGIYENLVQTTIAEDIKNKNSDLKRKIKSKIEFAWKIVLFMSLSHFLSFCVYLFYIFSDMSGNNHCPLLIPEDQEYDNKKLVVLNVLVMVIVKIICYFLPILVITITFWMKREGNSESTIEEEDENVFFYRNLTFNSVNKGGNPKSYSSSSDAAESNTLNLDKQIV